MKYLLILILLLPGCGDFHKIMDMLKRKPDPCGMAVSLDVQAVNAPKNYIIVKWSHSVDHEYKYGVYSIAHVYFLKDGKFVYFDHQYWQTDKKPAQFKFTCLYAWDQAEIVIKGWCEHHKRSVSRSCVVKDSRVHGTVGGGVSKVYGN